MVLDFGAHLYPSEVLPEPIANGPINEVIGSLLTDPDELCSLYESGGIDEAVLSQPFYMGHDDAEMVATANDALLDVVQNYNRFYGLAAIPTSAGGDRAAEEFERALDAGYHGGAVETKTNGVELTSDELRPVFEVADRTGAPLFVHPKLDESLHPAVLDDRYFLNAIFGREAALSESITKIINEGILSEFPNTSLVYHHLGGNIASMLGRVALQLDPGRWPGQDHVLDYDSFYNTLTSRIYLDTSGFFGSQYPLESTISEFPSSQILFGTDYPFEPRSSDELAMLRNAVRDVVPSEESAILQSNAKSLLTNC